MLNVKHRHIQCCAKGLLNMELEAALGKGSCGRVSDVEVSMGQRISRRKELPFGLWWVCCLAAVYMHV